MQRPAHAQASFVFDQCVKADPVGYIAGQQFEVGHGITTVLPDFDFETYSEAGFLWDDSRQKWGSLPGGQDNKRGLPTCGLHAYVAHPTFEILSLAYDLKDGIGKHHWKPGDPMPADLLEHVRRGGLLEAWNSAFELHVWNAYCTRVFGWPAIHPDQMRCAMSKSRAFAMPGGLGDASEVMNFTYKKDPDGDRLIKKFSVPCNPTTKNARRRRYLHDEPDEALRLYAYNVRDIMAEEEGSLRCPDLSPFELSVWQADQDVNRRGVQIDTKALDDFICVLEQAERKYNGEVCAITGGAVSEVSEVEKLRDWLASRSCYMDDMKWETVDAKVKQLEQAGVAKDDPVMRALVIRRSLGAASVKKVYSIRNALSPEGRLHELFIYFGTRTGRWTAVGAQPQNLYKGSLIKSPEDQDRALAVLASRDLDTVEREYGDAIEIIACAIRSLFIARFGHRFVSSDFSAIEGVVGACLANEAWRIEVFRTHGKIYEVSAGRIAKVPLEEFIEHKKRTGNHHPLRNSLGKLAELSGQFGAWVGGWNRFGAREITGSDENTKDIILKWRDESPNIVETWGGQTRGRFENARPELYGLEGAAISAVLYPGYAFECKGIVYQMKGDVLYCRVPSGGLIVYHAPRLQQSNRFAWTPAWELALSYEGWNSNPQMGPTGWTRMSLYGGKLFENVVQRVARDFQCVAMLAVQAAGYPVVLHGHDELVAEVPLGFGSIQHFESVVNEAVRAIGWARLADGTPWPVKMSGGWEGPRYGKFD